MQSTIHKTVLAMAVVALVSAAAPAFSSTYSLRVASAGLRAVPPVVPLPPTMAAPLYVVLTSGSSYALPANAALVTAWVIGGGGGGAGAAATDKSAGGGGAAGGLAMAQFDVHGGTLSYALGVGGTGGVGATNGVAGTNSTLTVAGSTVVGNGGGGGLYNTGAVWPGGGYSGPAGITGGRGNSVSDDTGGGGGGGIGGAPDATRTANGLGFPGAQSRDYAGLFQALTAAGYSTGGQGGGGLSGSTSTANVNHGGSASGFGSGGGGAGYYGGNGGNGLYGGGGGGAAGYSAIVKGGTAGSGAIVLQIE